MLHDFVEVADYADQASQFMAKSREHLAQDDLHQASEKGWGAAAHMAKAVAVAQGWEYSTHADFSEALYKARLETGNAALLGMSGIANELHTNYYRRKRHLNAAAIGEQLESVAELLDILRPLTARGADG